jgi:hypothetical protein
MGFEAQEVDEFVDSGMHECGSDDAGLALAFRCWHEPARPGGPECRRVTAGCNTLLGTPAHRV